MHLSRRAFRALASLVILGSGGWIFWVAGRSWPHTVHELGREKSAIGGLSVLLLGCGAAVSVALASRRRAFLLLGVALTLLAVDERAMGHERLKRWMLGQLFDWDRARMGVVGDLPLLLIPLLGGALLFLLRESFRPPPRRPLLFGALALGAVALGLDLGTLHPLAQAVEEVLEVAAEVLFLLALLAALTPSVHPPVDAG